MTAPVAIPRLGDPEFLDFAMARPDIGVQMLAPAVVAQDPTAIALMAKLQAMAPRNVAAEYFRDFVLDACNQAPAAAGAARTNAQSWGQAAQALQRAAQHAQSRTPTPVSMVMNRFQGPAASRLTNLRAAFRARVPYKSVPGATFDPATSSFSPFGPSVQPGSPAPGAPGLPTPANPTAATPTTTPINAAPSMPIWPGIPGAIPGTAPTPIAAQQGTPPATTFGPTGTPPHLPTAADAMRIAIATAQAQQQAQQPPPVLYGPDGLPVPYVPQPQYPQPPYQQQQPYAPGGGSPGSSSPAPADPSQYAPPQYAPPDPAQAYYGQPPYAPPVDPSQYGPQYAPPDPSQYAPPQYAAPQPPPVDPALYQSLAQNPQGSAQTIAQAMQADDPSVFDFLDSMNASAEQGDPNAQAVIAAIESYLEQNGSQPMASSAGNADVNFVGRGEPRRRTFVSAGEATPQGFTDADYDATIDRLFGHGTIPPEYLEDLAHDKPIARALWERILARANAGEQAMQSLAAMLQMAGQQMVAAGRWTPGTVRVPLPPIGTSVEFSSPVLQTVVGQATLGQWLDSIHILRKPDGTYTGCLTGLVCTKVGGVAAGADPIDAMHKTYEHSWPLHQCMTIPIKDLRQLALQQLPPGTPASALDNAQLEALAVQKLLQAFCNTLRGIGYVLPLGNPHSAAGKTILDNIWDSVVKPVVHGGLSMVVGPQAADAAINTVQDLAKNIGNAISPAKKKVDAIKQDAKAGNPAAQQAQQALVSVADAKAKADEVQKELDKKKDQADSQKLTTPDGRITIINNVPPQNTGPIDTRYYPPPTHALAPEGSAHPAFTPSPHEEPKRTFHSAGETTFPAEDNVVDAGSWFTRGTFGRSEKRGDRV